MEKNGLNLESTISIYEVLKCKTEQDEEFLIERGLMEAKRKNLILELGYEVLEFGKFLRNRYANTSSHGDLHNPKTKISLPTSNGKTDATNLIALIAQDYSQIARRYFEKRYILEHLCPISSSPKT